MGVYGLSTYLREHKHSLAHTLSLSQSSSRPQHIPVVVDAWSFIYEVVHYANLPWVYGGEYPTFAWLIEQVVRAWLSVGLELHFVFDGPYPPLKFPTLISRVSHTNVQSLLLFFRTSSAARASPRFLHETAMLPPLAFSVCVETLLRLSSQLAQDPDHSVLHVHFADEEGDPYAIALAGRLQAYIMGQDSDFVVLNTEGYRGYIPLEEMVWTMATSPSAAPWDNEGSVYSASVSGESESMSGEADEDGFQTVRKSKSRKKGTAASQEVQAGRGILPPDVLAALPQFSDQSLTHSEGTLALSFSVYSPSTLATHLDIPVSLLPLLGALLGNDYTGAAAPDDTRPAASTSTGITSGRGKTSLQRLFFHRQLTLAQRINRVAGILGNILSTAFSAAANGGSRGKRGGKSIGSVMELIDAAVTALLVRPLDSFATGEREAVVERVAEATLQYAVPKFEGAKDARGSSGSLWEASDVCIMHTPETCPLYGNLSGLLDRPLAEKYQDEALISMSSKEPLEQVRERYVRAYRRGNLDPRLLDTVHTGTMWPRMFLEDPDKECVVRSVARAIRFWTYAIFNAGVGLPSAAEPEQDQATQEEGDDDDEVIDVVEEDSEDEDVKKNPDPLARLKGALKELDGLEDDDDADTENTGGVFPPSTPSASAADARKTVITEYVRRGTRLAAEDIDVPSLSDILAMVSFNNVPFADEYQRTLPPQLWPDDIRRTLFLRALVSDYPAVSKLPSDLLMSVLAVRSVVRSMDMRWKDSPRVKERFLERWTQTEARAVLASFSDSVDYCPQQDQKESEAAQVVERHVQLVAQVLAALSAIEQLAQVLLLSSTIRSPAGRFSGARCHGLLSGRIAPSHTEPAENAWKACLEGLEDAYALPTQKKSKEKEKRGKVARSNVTSSPRGKARSAAGGLNGGMFELLRDAQA